MNTLLTIEGVVLGATDEVRSLAVKDKDGVPTGQMKDHRFTKIQVLVTLGDKSQAAVNCESFDAPATFALPKNGSTVKLAAREYSIASGFHSVRF